MLNEREQTAHDPTIAETTQGLSLAFEKLKADISQSRAARFVLAVLEKLKGAIQMEKTLKTGKIGQFGAESRITYADKQGFAGKGKTKAEISQSEDGQTRPTREEHRKTPRRSGGARSIRTLGNGYCLQREADFKKSPSCADGAEDATGNYRAYAGSNGRKHYKGT